MEIKSSGVSVYEVVLDLKQWEGRLTNQVPGFMDCLIRFLPSTVDHKCLSGQPGGFHEELARGTSFGHVVEHVLVELIRLSEPGHREYSGWTKALGDGRYTIHYGAPGFLAGRLAAVLAVEIVGKLQAGEIPELDHYVEQMRNPMEYFCRNLGELKAVGPSRTLSMANLLDTENLDLGLEPAPSLSNWQRDSLVRTLVMVEERLPEVARNWETAFCAFGGDFARGILDKVELLNPDHFRECFVKGDFNTCFQGVANLSQMLRTMRIPLSFVIHSVWLYKNLLQVVILECNAEDPDSQSGSTSDFDDFFQNVFHAVIEGYSRSREKALPGHESALCDFRARHAQPGAVLVVDDDILARKVARNILEVRGISTFGARDGVEALKVMADRGDAIRVVLLDLVMPGMAGQVVCRRIRDNHPNVRVILCSGYPLDKAARDCLEEHAVSFLLKPYRSSELVEMVADLMDLVVIGEVSISPTGS